MAENKKSFVCYCEWQETFEELDDAEAGKLIKHIFKYVNDENPKTDSKTVKLCFIPIKQTLKRDLKKYEVYIDKQRANGALGGRPKKTQKTQRLISKPKKADSVSVNVNDITKSNIPDKNIFMIYIKDYCTKNNMFDTWEKGKQKLAITYDAWIENGWKDGNNKTIKNWKSKAQMQLRYIR